MRTKAERVKADCGRPAHAGFTLIEIMIALAITAIVITSLVMIFVSQQKSYTQQTEIAKSQANARGALFAMARDIRIAGFSGVPLGFDELARQGTMYPIITPNISDNNIDQETIEIYGNFSRVTTTLLGGATPSPIFAGDGSLKVTDPSIFEGGGINQPVMLVVGDSNRTVEIHKIKENGVAADGTITLADGDSFGNGYEVAETTVAPLFRRKYWVDSATHTLWMRNCDTPDFTDNCPSGASTRLATGIDRIQFSYDLTNTAGSAITSNQPKACNPCTIRAVTLRLWSYTQNKYKPDKIINLEFGTAVKIRNIGFETTTCAIAGCGP